MDKNKKRFHVNLADGSELEIKFSESDIKVESVKTGKLLYSFNSSDVRGILFYTDDPQEYLLEQVASDSNIDEVIDTLESVKDNIKELYKENPNLINYFTGENLPQEQRDMLTTQPLPVLKGYEKPIWKHTWFIVVAILVVLFLLLLRHSILCSLQGGEIRDPKFTPQSGHSIIIF